jgi:anti-sigma-K factor RskA
VGSNPTVVTYAAGAAYSLTAVSALLAFGTTTPIVVLSARGVWRITATCRLNYVAATFAANQTVSLKLRRTNNTAADLANATAALTTRVIAAVTDNAGMMHISVLYETENDNDQIELWGSIDVIPGAGTIDAVSAKVVAERFCDRLT